jgi:hypothetical protein
MGLEYEELTGRVIGAAIAVHKALGPGFLESVYENALAPERHRLDLLVAELIVVELKAVESLEDIHFAVVRSYLRATGREHGLILNFTKPALEIKRVIASEPPRQDLLVSWFP